MWAITVVGPNNRRIYVREVTASHAAAGNSGVSTTVHTSKTSDKHNKQHVQNLEKAPHEVP